MTSKTFAPRAKAISLPRSELASLCCDRQSLSKQPAPTRLDSPLRIIHSDGVKTSCLFMFVALLISADWFSHKKLPGSDMFCNLYMEIWSLSPRHRHPANRLAPRIHLPKVNQKCKAKPPTKVQKQQLSLGFSQRPTVGIDYKFWPQPQGWIFRRASAVPINSRLDAANDSARPWPDTLKKTDLPLSPVTLGNLRNTLVVINCIIYYDTLIWFSDMWIHVDLWSFPVNFFEFTSGCLFVPMSHFFAATCCEMNLGGSHLLWTDLLLQVCIVLSQTWGLETPEAWDHKVGILDELNHPKKYLTFNVLIGKAVSFLWHPSCLLLGHQHALNIPKPKATHPKKAFHIPQIEPASSNAHLLRGSFQLNASPVCWQPASPFFSYTYILKHN